MLANKHFSMIALAHVYGPTLVAAIVPSVTIVWQINRMNTELSRVLIEEIRSINQDVKDLILVNGHHVMSALDGNKEPMRKWLTSHERCLQSQPELKTK